MQSDVESLKLDFFHGILQGLRKGGEKKTPAISWSSVLDSKKDAVF